MSLPKILTLDQGVRGGAISAAIFSAFSLIVLLHGVSRSGAQETAVPTAATASASPVIIRAGQDWSPYTHELEIEKGGIFDFSSLADSPAGKHGHVIATSSGQLEYEKKPGQPVRFWGVNLCFDANFLDHEKADKLAERLSMSGYNTVRFHHYDRLLGKEGGRSHEFDPDRLDRLDYLFAALKKRGLYITIDLYSNRRFTVAEIPDLGSDIQSEFKALLPLSDTAFDSWKNFAGNLLSHTNPYTGLTWASDPALLSICPVNEDAIFGTWEKKKPGVAKLYDAAFKRWLETRPSPPADSSAAFNEFLIETQKNADNRMRDYLRSLGVRALITGSNFRDTMAQVYLRERYDAVENHNYWNHPTFIGKDRWQLPIKGTQNSTAGRSVWLPRMTMASRIFGKPFFVTEFNYVWPNQARSEGGVLMPAYASLQDWSALYNFDYAATADLVFNDGVATRAGYIFSLSADPVGLLADRVSAVLFLRRDIEPAPHGVCYLVTRDAAFSGKKAEPQNFRESFGWLGMVTRIGSLSAESGFLSPAGAAGVGAYVSGKEVAGAKPLVTNDRDYEGRIAGLGIFPAANFDKPNKRFVSETGQIRLDVNQGTVVVAAPRCELFIIPPGSQLTGRLVTVRNPDTFSSVSIVSADHRPIEASRRLLILHLTDSLNTETRFSDPKREILESIGKLPHLVRAGSAQITLNLPQTEGWRAWAVSAGGRRLREISLTTGAGGLTLPVATVTAEGTCLAYELAKTAD